MKLNAAVVFLVGSAGLAMGATFTVTSTNDSGAGSLRQAMLDAEADPLADVIAFDIPGAGPHTIAPLTQFPTNTTPVLIDGYTQPGSSPNTLSNGFNAVIQIRIIGTSNGSFQPTAFRLQNGSTLRGLAIVLWNNRTGIEIIAGGSSNTVAGCLIGINVDGTQQRASIGLHIRNSPGNRIGGTAPADRNVISYNFSHGVFIDGTSASNNVVRGNFIGTDFNGTAIRANFGNGVEVQDAPGNIIGGLESGARNLMSGNQIGVRIRGFGSARGNVIQGNFIGVNVTGTAALANSADGIVIDNAQQTLVGGATAGGGNLISGNAGFGINISTTTSTGTSIQGNLIGTSITGAALPNGTSGAGGIAIAGSSNLIGGALVGEANVIAFNRGPGVNVFVGTQNQIRGNSIHSNTNSTSFPVPIGIDLGNDNITANDAGDGDTGANNRQNFPLITSASGNGATTTVQGTLNSMAGQTYQLDFFGNTACDPSGNGEGQFYLGNGTVLTDGSGNGGFNVTLAMASPGQFITATATDPFGNTSEFSPCFQATIAVPPMTFTVVNTNDAGAGSLRQAILDSNAHLSSSNNTVAFNIPAAGLQVIRPLTALPVFIRPVTIDGFTQPGASANTISNGNNANWLVELAGTLAGANQDGLRLNIENLVVRGLRISRFSSEGIEITSSNAVVAGNNIYSNSSGGIYINAGNANRIGGAAPADRNLLSGNSGSVGVDISRGNGNRVLGNFIGTDASGTAAFGNQFKGVDLTTESTGNVIGGVAPCEANWIAFHSSAGVSIQGGTNNPVRGNRFFSNSGLGIDLWSGGVTANDLGDGDSGPNQIQNFPILTNGTANLGNTVIQGTLNSRPNTAYDLDFYSSAVCNSSSSRQGQTYLGSATVLTDENGDVAFNVNLPTTAFGSFLTATATDPNGNTSEFSPCLQPAVNLPPVTYVVLNTNNSGAGSLRQAIIDVGATPNAGVDSIHFNIPGAGPHRINLLTPLPSPTQPVILDGYTQPGAAVNTASTNDNAVLKIQLDGAQMSGSDALLITNGNTVIRGLSFTRFTRPIWLQGQSNVVEGNWFGVDPVGAMAGNIDAGVMLRLGGWNRIGGSTPAARNIISGTTGSGVLMGTDTSNNIVEGNFIGLAPNGMGDYGNTDSGVRIVSSDFNTVGGTNLAAGNSIFFNDQYGVSVEFGGRQNGIFNNIMIGNGFQNIFIAPGANDGVQPPVLTRAFTGSTIVQGTFQGMPNTTYEVEVVAVVPNPLIPIPIPLRSFSLTTDAQGKRTIEHAFPEGFPPFQTSIHAIITCQNSSSEESNVVLLVPGDSVDLGIANIDAPSSAEVGQTVTITVTITNGGPATAQEILAGVRLSSSLKVTTAEFSHGRVEVLEGGTVRPEEFSLEDGGTATLTITAVVTGPGDLEINALVDAGEGDRNSANNESATGIDASVPSPGPQVIVTAADTTSAADSLEPVSMFTGELFEPMSPDLNLGGPMPLVFNRYYASFLKRAGRLGTLGDNWRHNHEWTLTNRTTTVEVKSDLGRLITFTNNAGNYGLIERTDIPFQLQSSGGNFILADPRSQRIYIFNSAGKLTQIQDGHGNTHTLVYAGNNLTSVSDGLGRALTFQYSGSGFLTNVSDGARSIAFTQTGNNLTTMRDALGFITTYAYNLTNANSGLMTNTVMPEGNVPYAQTFDSLGRVATQTEAGTNTHTFTYAPNLTTLTDPLGRTRKDVHTPTGENVAFTDETGLSLAMAYNMNAQRTVIADRLNHLTRLGHHTPSGYVSAITNADGTFTTFAYTNRTVNGVTFYDLAQVTYPDGATESLTRDSNGNILTRTDRAGNVFTFTYNARGQMLTAQNPRGGIVTLTYHANGTLASRTDSDTGTTTFSYDSFSRLTNVIHPDGTTLKAAYDANDRVTSITDERNNTSTFAYDDNGNLISVTDPLSQTAQFAYDTRDRLLQAIDRLGKTSSVSYDQLDQVVGRTDRNGNVTQFAYDTRRRMTSMTDPGNQVWNFGYDHEALLTSASNPLNQTNRIRRDALGYVVGTTNALSQSASLVRDSLRRVVRRVDALTRTNGFGYDSRGLLTNSTAPVIGTAAYQRNSLGLLSRITGLNGEQWKLAYTPMGRRQSIADPLNRTNRFTYDNRGRAAITTFADGTTRSNSYDQAGNVTRRFYSAGPDLQYTYDALDRVISADNLALAYDAESRITNTTSSGVQFRAGYDAGGRLTNVTYNGGVFSVTYAYDSRDRLISASDSLTGTALNFTHDNAGRLTGTTRPNGVNGTYTYDAAGRLTRIQEGAIIDLQYGLDAGAQVTNLSYTMPLEPTNFLSGSISNWTYDAAHQISNSGYTYDARGRQTAAPGRTQQYDAASRLTQINSATLGYNGFSDIITRTEGGVTTRYFYNHALGMKPIVAEKNENTGQFRYYIWSPGGRLLYMIDNGNVVRHFHFDRVGSTLALTDAGGPVTDSYAYTPYGELLGRTGTNPQPFLFVGRLGVRSEPGAKLYHMRARYYDPVTARFLTRDPIWPVIANPMSLDPYQYVEGNPLSLIDPLGLLTEAAGNEIADAFMRFFAPKELTTDVPPFVNQTAATEPPETPEPPAAVSQPQRFLGWSALYELPFPTTLSPKHQAMLFAAFPNASLITQQRGKKPTTASSSPPSAPSAVQQTGVQSGLVDPEKLEWILFPTLKYLQWLNPKRGPSDRGGGGQTIDPKAEEQGVEDSILNEIDEVLVIA